MFLETNEIGFSFNLMFLEMNGIAFYSNLMFLEMNEIAFSFNSMFLIMNEIAFVPIRCYMKWMKLHFLLIRCFLKWMKLHRSHFLPIRSTQIEIGPWGPIFSSPVGARKNPLGKLQPKKYPLIWKKIPSHFW
jgi:hypothetical protein